MCTVAASDFLTPSIPFKGCLFNLGHDFVERKKVFDGIICIFNACRYILILASKIENIQIKLFVQWVFFFVALQIQVTNAESHYDQH